MPLRDPANISVFRKIMQIVKFCILLLSFIPIYAATGYSQTLMATLRGELTDAAGDILPDVQLIAIHVETQTAYRTQSDSEGEYTFSSLAPGTYRLEAELAGFRKYVLTGIELSIRQNVRLNISLEAGAPDHEIFVYSKTAMVQPDSMNLGAVIENDQVVNLPLDKRNFLQLGLLLPGTAPSAQGSPGTVRGEFAFNVNGSREDSNNYILDGVFNNDPKLNSYSINPPVDAINEFEILSSTYDAGFGRSGGAQVNIALKSGTHRFHGTGYEFFQNAALNARNYFARSEDPDPRFQHNQFGFSLGGPIIRNRTFFFGDYEGRRERKGITQVASVPTELEREGNLPPGFESEIGSNIAHLYPLPNYDGPGGNYVSSPILHRRGDRFDLRIDHAISERSRLISRYSFYDYDLYEPFSGVGFALVPGYGVDVARRAQNFMIGEDHVFSPSLINQFRIALNRVAFGAFQEQRGGSLNTAVGLPELSEDPRDHGLSMIRVTGFSPLGDEQNNPQHSVTNVFQITDTLQYSTGKHLLKFGFDFRALQQNAYRNVLSRGLLNFTGLITGDSMTDLLMGLPTFTTGARLDNPQYLRTKSINFFVHDSYRVRRNVTLLLGLRYEYNQPPVDKYDRATTYDPDSRSLVPVGQNGVPRGVYHPDRNNWAPRVGVAWAIDEDSTAVLRAGYGIYYDQSSLAPGEGLYFNQPYYDLKYYYTLPGYTLTLQDPFPEDYPFTIPVSALGFDPRLRSTYFQQWNVTLEKQFGSDSYFELSYAGSKGTKILSARDINQPMPSPVSPNPRPVPQFADIIFLESSGSSSYHSLQARFQQRLRYGVSATVAYTYGKSLDTSSTFFASTGDSNFPQNSYDLGAEKGRSNFDVRHRFSLAYSYDLPVGQGRSFLADRGFLSTLLAGWSSYGIITFQSGRPFTVALLPELDNSNTGYQSLGFAGANNRPDRIGSGKLSDPGPGQWFDTTAFALADYGSFGNSGRNILDGPGYRDVSISIVKDTRIRDEISVQFRTEFLNAFNNVNFDLPDSFYGSQTFGSIHSAQDPRRIQFGLKIIF